jgi:hypothetical protein
LISDVPYLVKAILLSLASVLFLAGIILIYRSFRYNNKTLLTGTLGVLFLLFSGNVVIYLYSCQSVPKRVIEEWHREELPDLGISPRQQGKLNLNKEEIVEIEN